MAIIYPARKPIIQSARQHLEAILTAAREQLEIAFVSDQKSLDAVAGQSDESTATPRDGGSHGKTP